MATPIDVVVLKCRKICPTGNRRNRALFTGQIKKIRFPLELSLLSGSLPKSARRVAHIGPNSFEWFHSLVVRASDLRLNGREFGSRQPHYRSVGTRMGDRLQAGIPPRPPRSPQPHSLCGTGNDHRPKCCDALRPGVKAGWLIPFVDKRVGGR